MIGAPPMSTSGALARPLAREKIKALYNAKFGRYVATVTSSECRSMSALTRYFFSSGVSRRSTWDTVVWWESRRLMYSVAVGGAGLVTLGWVNLLSLVTHGHFMPIPWQAPLVYGVMANVCYTLGWGAELALERVIGDNAPTAGAAIFRYGFVFSVGLTLFPAVIVTLGEIAQLLFR